MRPPPPTKLACPLRPGYRVRQRSFDTGRRVYIDSEHAATSGPSTFQTFLASEPWERLLNFRRSIYWPREEQIRSKIRQQEEARGRAAAEYNASKPTDRKRRFYNLARLRMPVIQRTSENSSLYQNRDLPSSRQSFASEAAILPNIERSSYKTCNKGTRCCIM